jgi:hypothetical protein
MNLQAFDFIAESAGLVAGWLVAPAIGMATRARKARLFHAEGQVYEARAEPDASDATLQGLAERLAGRVLVRVSAGIWQGIELPDVLGLSLRFHGGAVADPPPPDAQDLLFVSASSLLTLPLAFITTDPHDYMANTYDALATFQIEDSARGRLRARWAAPPQGTGSRAKRLSRAVAKRQAIVLIELCLEHQTEWHTLVRVRLIRPSRVDQTRLAFSPFQDGRGLRPTGFVQALRKGAYRAGQLSRGVAVSHPSVSRPGANPRSRSGRASTRATAALS